MKLIPAIDLIGGRCVRLQEGDYDRQTAYYEDPLDMARQLEDHGLEYLHLVDLDGAKAGRVINWEVLKRITQQTELKVDMGGGFKTKAEVREALTLGANQINIGSLAVKQPEVFAQWLQHFPEDTLILSADVRDRKIAVHGWQEQTEVDLFSFVEDYLTKGIQTVVCTDISKDGMLQGPAIELYRDLLQAFPQLQLVASGGVSSMQELEALRESGLYGAIIGKALYEGNISLKDLAAFAQ